jgi:hypothetical protein
LVVDAKGWRGRTRGFGRKAVTPGLAGCSGDGARPVGPTFAVRGRVLLHGGKPRTDGRVAFVAQDGLSPPASGSIGPDGHLAVSTRAEGDGAAGAAGRPVKPPFPLKCVDEDSSGPVVPVREAA